MNILSINPGSSSLKVGLFGPDSDEALLRLSVEPSRHISELVARASEFGAIGAVACRVVHGADLFDRPALVTDLVLRSIQDLAPLAPLHNARDVAAIMGVREALPAVPVYAVFDTAFHRTIPSIASTYALPHELAGKNKLQRYGFHGISYRNVVGQSPGIKRLIACHLGSGASVCAISDGKSVDTSMGMTPLEGLMMGTRSGDIDPGLVLYLAREMHLSIHDIDHLLNRQSGLLGVSGKSADVRDLLVSNDPQADLALDMFSYRVAKYIGAYASVLGGVDALAFTGGIGEHSPEIRQRICRSLGFLGISIDPPGRVPVVVIAADEEAQMAREVRHQIS